MAQNKYIYELFELTNLEHYTAGTFCYDWLYPGEVKIMDLILLSNVEFIIKEEKVDDQIYYKKTISNKIKVGDSNGAYSYLKNNIDVCKRYIVMVYKVCTGNTKTFLYRTFFNTNNINFDFDSCSCDIDLQFSSMYDCIEANRNNKLSFLAFGPDVIDFYTSTPSANVYKCIDLRRFMEMLLRTMNCVGYENDLYYYVESPVSDFFNWQKYGCTTLSCIEDFKQHPSLVLTPLPNYVNSSDSPYHIALALKSNVLDPGASNPGIKYESTFSEMEKYLKDVFNVYWILVPNETQINTGPPYQPTGTYMRFEHYSWFVKNVNYDTTLATNFPLNRFKNKISINPEDFPYSEEWIFQDPLDVDFIGEPIIYKLCSGEYKKIQRTNSNLDNDINTIVNNPTGNYEKSGFMFVDLRIYNSPPSWVGLATKLEFGRISSLLKINGRLSTANFQYELHRHNRPTYSGIMNGITETFLSPVYKKIQSKMLAKFCCTDDFAKSESLVRTELGEGKIEEAEINYTKETITFKLNMP